MVFPCIAQIATRSCVYRTLAVRCPSRQMPAEVVVAKWKKTDGNWSLWKVIDCPLLPAGLIDCQKQCLSQVDLSGE
jgi:hypothetical protein